MSASYNKTVIKIRRLKHNKKTTNKHTHTLKTHNNNRTVRGKNDAHVQCKHIKKPFSSKDHTNNMIILLLIGIQLCTVAS